MEKFKVYATGLTGMVGQKIYEILKDKYYFSPQSTRKKADIVDYNSLFSEIKTFGADLIIHLAAKTDVDLCEKEKKLAEKSKTWQVNVVGSENLAKISQKLDLKMVYISTDFVFDGKKKGAYQEEDLPNPINFYGQTKFIGEKIVQKYLKRFLICRLSYPYGGSHFLKKDFVARIRKQFISGNKILGATDQLITPTLISDIAYALDSLISKKCRGIYHVAGSSVISPYQLSLEIAKRFGYDITLIRKTNWQDFYKMRTKRPQYLQISNEKLVCDTGCKMKDFISGLKKL